MTGIVVLLAAVVVAALVAGAMRWKNGRFTADAARSDDILSAADIGADLGSRATLVQFSSAFCSPCRATRALLTDVAGRVEGVAMVEIDAESHLDLVRRLDIMRTPTVLVLDSTGRITRRASGLPRRDQVVSAIGEAVVSSQ